MLLTLMMMLYSSCYCEPVFFVLDTTEQLTASPRYTPPGLTA
jgi:hypothetical protein